MDTIRRRRGLLALDPVAAGEVVITVPWSMCMTAEHVRNNTKHVLSRLATEEKDLDQVGSMYVYLCMYVCMYVCMEERKARAQQEDCETEGL